METEGIQEGESETIGTEKVQQMFGGRVRDISPIEEVAEETESLLPRGHSEKRSTASRGVERRPPARGIWCLGALGAVLSSPARSSRCLGVLVVLTLLAASAASVAYFLLPAGWWVPLAAATVFLLFVVNVAVICILWWPQPGQDPDADGGGWA